MKRILFAAPLVLAFIFWGTRVNSMSHEMVPGSGEASEVSKLIGMTVRDPRGEDLGVITDIVTGPEGRVAFAVLSYWISADTQKRVAVPFGGLSCKEQTCILNASKEIFDSAPIFLSEDELAERKLAEDIYSYFGVQPYWTEEGIQK
jgi:hypothetical protein